MKRLFSLLCLMCIMLALPAEGRSARVFLANDYGAKGDGTTLDTKAIQSALDAAAKAGKGVVTFAAGTYLTGALFVKAHTELHLDAGVILRGSSSLADYPILPTRVAGINMEWPAAVVNVYEQQDAAITGPGTLDGNGMSWWKGYWALRSKYDAQGLRWAADYDDRRPRLIQVYKSAHVKLHGLQLMRSGFWTVHICYSDHVVADGITIRNNIGGRGPSTDGIDIDSSSDVLVQHADISVNDDALCLKSGRDSDGLRVARPDERIVVRDSVVRDGAAAITIGSETSGGFRNIDVYGIHAMGHVSSGILFKSARTRGGWADSIRIHDLTLDGVSTPIHINMNWNPSYSYAHIPAGLTNIPPYYTVLATSVPQVLGLAHFRNVRIWNIRATAAKRAFDVSATPQAPLVDFTLHNIDIAAAAAGSVADVRDWRFSNVRVQAENAGAVSFHDAFGLQFTHTTGFNTTAADSAASRIP